MFGSVCVRQFLDVIGDAMKFLRANDKVDMRQIFQKRLAPRLRHASKKTENNFRPFFRHVSEHPHFPSAFWSAMSRTLQVLSKHDVGLRFRSPARS